MAVVCQALTAREGSRKIGLILHDRNLAVHCLDLAYSFSTKVCLVIKMRHWVEFDFLSPVDAE